jgi:hypothetical protein
MIANKNGGHIEPYLETQIEIGNLQNQNFCMSSCYDAQLLSYDYLCTARGLHLFYKYWVFHWYINHLKNLITQEDMNEQNLYPFFRPTVYFSFNFNLSCSLKE